MEGSVTFAVAFVAGVLSFLSPCVLPLVPSYLGFITGMSLDDLRGQPSRKAILVPALAFVTGFSLIFILMGLTATLLGQMLFHYQAWVSRIGGALIIVFALHLLGILRIPALLRERRAHLDSKPAGVAGAVIAGVVFGAGWTPCIGPVLGSVLTLASTNTSSGVPLLAFYSLGLAIPFVLSALLTGEFLNASKKFRRVMPVIEKISGVILLIAGILLLTGSFTVLSRFMTGLTPEWLLNKM